MIGIPRITVLALFLIAAAASPAFPASSVNVPLDSWVYRALDTLEAYSLIDSALSGTRPYSRLEAARLVREAMKKREELPARVKASNFAEQELIPSLLERLKNKFKPELIEIGALGGTAGPSFLKPVDEIMLKSWVQTEDPIVRPQPGLPDTHGIYPVYNHDGIVYRKRYNASLEVTGEGRLWNHLSLYYQPLFTMFDGEGGQVRLEKGYVKAEGFNVEIEAGRDSLWWGPGSHASLLMTNNARPFDLVKLSNPQPFLLPWVGLIKVNLFFSRLDYGEPYIAEPTLYGLRLNLKPHPVFELGLSHIVIFGGEGRKSLSIGDYFDIIYGNTNRENTKLDSNQQVAVDLSLRWADFHRLLPVARSLKFYGEYGAEDTGFLPDRRAYRLGLEIYDLLLSGRVDLRLEYANTSPSSVPGAWYTSSSYPPLYHERIFGHHAGSNAQDIYARLTANLSTRLTLGFDFHAETQGKKDAVTTDSFQWGIDAEYWIRDGLKIRGRYILESFRDSQSIAGGDRTGHLFGIELSCNF